ncbi:hypothetical protein [uncultured Chitinophaga sp.]|uniref:hypothetical protein n=1 Tax=uncultured Chitinophaga sp. TaxID=339340 RepID=UPI0025CFB1A6|nr:hypothetical protein [uncultured Chitinophaga sp.]
MNIVTTIPENKAQKALESSSRIIQKWRKLYGADSPEMEQQFGNSRTGWWLQVMAYPEDYVPLKRKVMPMLRRVRAIFLSVEPDTCPISFIMVFPKNAKDFKRLEKLPVNVTIGFPNSGMDTDALLGGCLYATHLSKSRRYVFHSTV